MLTRVEQRIFASGVLRVPAIPSLSGHYVETCARLFAACGRALEKAELEQLGTLMQARLEEAFAESQRSKVTVRYEAAPGQPLSYDVQADVQTVSDAYGKWLKHEQEPLFGTHADARVLALAEELGAPCSILDLGAGTGRNALSLARRGHFVDAVEMTPRFAAMLEAAAGKEDLPVRVIAKNLFEARASVGTEYGLFIASEVIPDFREPTELRALFELAASVLQEGGVLVVNLHLPAAGYTPEKPARQFAQHGYSAVFTPTEVAQAVAGLPLELVSNYSAYDYEREHLPEQAWPPTPWYENWASGLDVYELPRGECPLSLRWLTFEKRSERAGSGSTAAALTGAEPRRRFDPAKMRHALLQRVARRSTASGCFTLPALPALSGEYLEACFRAFSALGQEFTDEEITQGRELFERALTEAFAKSPRSNISVDFEAPMGAELRYNLSPEPVPLAQAYEGWLEALPEPLFGAQPDARLLTLVGELPDGCSVLDVGAGLGRNALPLARRGHAVTAVELTPAFADELERAVRREQLSIRVVRGDVFETATNLGGHYALVLASGFVGDLRSSSELRGLFELADEALSPGGFLLLNVHLCVNGYSPDEATRQWGQQSSAMFFTPDELHQALAGLPLELVADDAAHDYEQKHLPKEAWPPTAVYAEWALATHMFALEPARCPIALRWLVMKKLDA